jgi:3',5'-cyclic AMP phosphodiesterase CpdA
MMRLKFVLRDPELASCCKVLLLHHPITLTHTAKRKQLINSEQLCELLQQYPVELVLHGHGHTSTIDYLDHENGSRTPIIGMASSSSISQKLNQRAEFKLYEITQQTHKLELTMQNYVLDQQLKQFIASDKTQIV